MDTNMRKVLDYIDFEKIKNIDFSNINWTKIANKIETKSKDDCKNKWTQQMHCQIFAKSSFDSDDD